MIAPLAKFIDRSVSFHTATGQKLGQFFDFTKSLMICEIGVDKFRKLFVTSEQFGQAFLHLSKDSIRRIL
jgi:hypothetical protein